MKNELGEVIRQNGENRFTHIPDWYSWERECVRQEILEGTYKLDVPVSIGLMVNHEAIYMVGDGKLIHDNNGFHLSADDGSFNYEQAPQCLYYCFPKVEGVVAKTRLATEELYKLVNKR